MKYLLSFPSILAVTLFQGYGQETKGEVKNTGLFLVSVRGEFGYIDTTGRYICRPRFDEASAFSEGLAAVRLGRKWGYVDKTGKIVLAAVSIGRKYGYVDRTGDYVINPQFNYAGNFSEGLAAINLGGHQWGEEVKGGKWGFIDRTGKHGRKDFPNQVRAKGCASGYLAEHLTPSTSGI